MKTISVSAANRALQADSFSSSLTYVTISEGPGCWTYSPTMAEAILHPNEEELISIAGFQIWLRRRPTPQVRFRGKPMTR
jgi:hypothetical protein